MQNERELEKKMTNKDDDVKAVAVKAHEELRAGQDFGQVMSRMLNNAAMLRYNSISENDLVRLGDIHKRYSGYDFVYEGSDTMFLINLCNKAICENERLKRKNLELCQAELDTRKEQVAAMLLHERRSKTALGRAY